MSARRAADRHLARMRSANGYRRLVKLATGRPPVIVVSLNKVNLFKFVDAAARRGIKPSDLARRVLTAVMEGDLLDAVLDDGPGA